MDYFPLTVAKAPAFCNRKSEQQRLKTNIQQARPTLIVSPRRYGKTSLALNVLSKMKLLYVKFDLLSVTDEKDIKDVILHGTGKLLIDIERGPKKALRLATELFAGLNIKIAMDKFGLAVEIGKSSLKPAYEILNIFERIEKISKKYGKRIVLFFDEFQRVIQVTEDAAIASVIRQIAQTSKHLIFIFSGSDRHLLHKIFDDREQPFYKLCDRMTIERISKDYYIPYIQHAAQVKWRKGLTEEAIERIFTLTERHPYYVNVLCSRLWDRGFFVAEDVTKSWQQYLLEERAQVGAELDLLSKNQRKLLAALARNDATQSPRGHEFQVLARMSGASISQAIGFLEKKDYIYKDSQGNYRVLDPLIKDVLVQINI